MKQNQRKRKYQCKHKGTTFTAQRRDTNVIVRVQKSARGQSLLAGVLDLIKGTWYNENKRQPLPETVKREMERAFAA